MDLSYEGVSDDTKHTKYVFKSEITVKNDTFGWALWVGSKYMKTGSVTDTGDSNQKGAEYYLLFLEKVESGWSVIGGYFWTDLFGSTQSYNLDILQIFTPDTEDWASQIRNHKGKTTKEHKEYSGVWIASGSGNEVFQDIGFWYGGANEKSTSAEILGRVDTDFSGEPKIKSAEAYKDSYGWRPFNNNTRRGEGEEIGQTLNTFYEPFKNQKGTWVRSEEYCSRNKTYSRELKDAQLEELENLCYSPQTSSKGK